MTGSTGPRVALVFIRQLSAWLRSAEYIDGACQIYDDADGDGIRNELRAASSGTISYDPFNYHSKDDRQR